MIKRRLIAIDIDDVLSASAAGFIAFSNQRWGTVLTVDDFNEDLEKMWGVGHEEVVRRLKTFFTSNIVEGYPLIDGSAQALGELRKEYDLVAVTSRVVQMMPMTIRWLQRHYPKIALEVHPAGIWDTLEKNAHQRTKAELCLSLGADYLIDDQLKHCVAAADRGVLAVLFGEYPWNQAYELPKDVTRCRDWTAVLEYFDGRER